MKIRNKKIIGNKKGIDTTRKPKTRLGDNRNKRQGNTTKTYSETKYDETRNEIQGRGLETTEEEARTQTTYRDLGTNEKETRHVLTRRDSKTTGEDIRNTQNKKDSNKNKRRYENQKTDWSSKLATKTKDSKGLGYVSFLHARAFNANVFGRLVSASTTHACASCFSQRPNPKGAVSCVSRKRNKSEGFINLLAA